MDQKNGPDELLQRALPARDQRRLLPSQTTSLAVVRNQRRWLARTLDRLLTRLHDPSLSNDELGAANSEANAVLRERREWDTRLVELGGILEPETILSSQSTDTIYFGRARELAEAQDPPQLSRQSDDHSGGDNNVHGRTLWAGQRADPKHRLYQLVDADYYGLTHAQAPPPLPSPTPPRLPSRDELERELLEAKKTALLRRLKL